MFGVSEVTISKTYKKIEKIKHLLSNDNEINKLLIKIKKNQDSEKNDNEIDPLLLERMKKFGISVNNK